MKLGSSLIINDIAVVFFYRSYVLSLVILLLLITVGGCKRKNSSSMNEINFGPAPYIPPFSQNGAYENFDEQGKFLGIGQVPPGAVIPSNPGELLIDRQSYSSSADFSTSHPVQTQSVGDVDIGVNSTVASREDRQETLSMSLGGSETDYDDIINPGGEFSNSVNPDPIVIPNPPPSPPSLPPSPPSSPTPAPTPPISPSPSPPVDQTLPTNTNPPPQHTPGHPVNSFNPSIPQVHQDNVCASNINNRQNTRPSVTAQQLGKYPGIEKFAFQPKSLTQAGWDIFRYADRYVDLQETINGNLAGPMSCVLNLTHVFFNVLNQKVRKYPYLSYLGNLISYAPTLYHQILAQGGHAYVFPPHNTDPQSGYYQYSGQNLKDNITVLSSDKTEYQDKIKEMINKTFPSSKRLPPGAIIMGCERDCSSHGDDRGAHVGVVGDLDHHGNINVYHNNWFRPGQYNGKRIYHMVPGDAFYKGRPRKWMPTPMLKTNSQGDVTGATLPAINDLSFFDPNFMTVVLMMPDLYLQWKYEGFLTAHHNTYLADNSNIHYKNCLSEITTVSNPPITICKLTKKIDKIRQQGVFFSDSGLQNAISLPVNECGTTTSCSTDSAEFRLIETQGNAHKIMLYLGSTYYGQGGGSSIPNIWIKAQKVGSSIETNKYPDKYYKVGESPPQYTSLFECGEYTHVIKKNYFN